MTAEIKRLFPDPSPARNDAAALAEASRIVEALLFAASEALNEAELSRRLPADVPLAAVMAKLRSDYAERGIHPVRAGAGWVFRTADDLGWLLSPSARETVRLSRAALETLAIVAYHQPATRADIEAIRGVAVGKGTLDVLLATGWIRPRGRRRTPGRPIVFCTTDDFLLHFGLETIGDLPKLDELRGACLFDDRLPRAFTMPSRGDEPPDEDEDPLLEANDRDEVPLLRDGD